MESAAHVRRRAGLLVVVAGTAFATSGPLGRWAWPLHPLFIACGRVALAAILLAALDLRGVVGSLARLDGRQRGGIALAGMLLGAHFGLFQLGLDRTSLPAAVSLVSLEPIGVVLLGWALHGVRPTALEQLGVLLATGGAVLVARGAGVGDHRLAGDLVVLAAVPLYGLYVNVARLYRLALPATQYAALVYSVAALALAASLFFVETGPAAGWNVPAHSAIAVLALALVPTLVGHTAVQAAARSLAPAIVALATPGETLGSLAIGAALLHALPTPTEMAGAAVILGGVTVAMLGAQGRGPVSAPPS